MTSGGARQGMRTGRCGPGGNLAARTLLASLTIAAAVAAFPGWLTAAAAQEPGGGPPIRMGKQGRMDFTFFAGRGNAVPGVGYDVGIGTAVVAPARGRIFRIGESEASGTKNYSVWLDHGYRYFSFLAGLSKVAVGLGQEVKRGEVIGSSGAIATQFNNRPTRTLTPQLYFAIQKNGKALDPEKMGAGGNSPTYWDGKTELDIAIQDDAFLSGLAALLWSRYTKKDADPLHFRDVVERRKSLSVGEMTDLVTQHAEMFESGTLELYKERLIALSQEKPMAFSAPLRRP